jgi:hypothetical protein
MKKISFLGLACIISAFCVAQIKTAPIIKEIKTENLKKTGNWQDVFANFYQLAFKNIVGPKKSFEFKSTLFALRSSVNPNLLVDTEYVKKRNVFDRNLQFNFGVNLDTIYKFKTASVGFTWAIINKRDSAILSFVGKEILERDAINKNQKRHADSLSEVQAKFGEDPRFIKDFETLEKMKDDGFIDTTKLSKEFLKICSATNLVLFNDAVSFIKEKIKKTKMKPFLSLSVYADFKNGNGIFNGGEAELIYLQGMTKQERPLELDVRLKTVIADTTINNDKYRSTLNFTGGFNYAIITSRIEHSPIIEFKPHIEYNYVARGLLPNEKNKLFTANATLRVRVLKNVWLPFTLKYDLENNNLLGFLNIAFNWDAFKAK